MVISGFGMQNSLHTGYDKFSHSEMRKTAGSQGEVVADEAADQAKRSKVLTDEDSGISKTVQAESASRKKINTEAIGTDPERMTISKGIQDFTFDFKKNNDFNLVGARSKVEDVDIKKALLDMKKDGVLEQYKFFVKGALVSDEDGSVRQVVRKDAEE